LSIFFTTFCSFALFFFCFEPVYALFGLGGLIQVTRFPEVVSRLAGVGRVWRGRFDMIGASHQLWHAFVVAGTVRHAMLCIQVHKRRVAEGCAAGEM
jgi:predicted membrane channel-forming protein YqfA (hemolysin III family)